MVFFLEIIIKNDEFRKCILFISFVEIYLMIRSSYLSRIKEIGIYRAIGTKKSDIYKKYHFTIRI